MFKKLLLTMLLLPAVSAAPTTVKYGQVLIHSADGNTYIVTGTLTQNTYKILSSGDLAGCMIIDGAIGFPTQPLSDRIFENGFEAASICY